MKNKILSLLISFIFLSGNYFEAHGQVYKWNSVAIGGGGFVSAVVPSKTQENLMYARTDVGGAYRWDASTGKWIPLLDWVSANETGYLGVESIALDPQASNKVYMLVGLDYFNNGKTAILSSSDYGNTFTVTDVTAQFKAHGNGMGRQNGERLIVDPNNSNTLYCGTRRNGLFRSTNAGASWARLTSLDVTGTPNDNGVCFVVADKSSGSAGSNSQKLFVGVSRTGTNFYMSTNGGTTFTAVSGAPTSLMPQRAALAGDGNLYITYANGAGPHGHWALPEPMDLGEIWKYNTSNGTWTNVTPSGFTRAFGGISVDPANPDRLIASSVNTYNAQYNGPEGTAWGDRFFLSTNGGSSWRDLVGSGITMNPNGSSWVNGHALHWTGCIEFNPFNTAQAWVTSGNGIFSCDNVNAATTNWKFNCHGIEETVPLDIVSIPGGPVVSVIGDYDGFIHTDVTQFPPIHTPRMGTSTGIAYAALNTNKMLRVGDRMYYTTNQGTSWTECTINGKKGRVAVSADGNVFLHCPELSSTTYRSMNNGNTWTVVTGLNFNESMPVADQVNASKFYAYNNSSGVMMVSTNGGISFTNAGTPGAGGSKIIRTVPGKEGHIWVALNGGGLSRSTNSGASFTKITGVSSCSAVGLGKEAEGSAYHTIYIWGTVGGVTGVFRSTDEGTSWIRVNDDRHEYGGPGNGQFVIGDMNTFGRVYMSTAGRGIAYGEQQAECTPTDIVPYYQVNGGAWMQSSEVNINSGDPLILSPQPNSGGSWSWTGCGISGTGREQSFNPTAPCTATATYTNSCGAISTQDFAITVNIPTSVYSPGIMEAEVQAYPNPFQKEMNLIVKSRSTHRINIKVAGLNGEIIYTSDLFSTNETIPLGKELATGIYMVLITGEDGTMKSVKVEKR